MSNIRAIQEHVCDQWSQVITSTNQKIEHAGDKDSPIPPEPVRAGFFLPVVTARYTAVTAATAGVRNGTQR
jgi:hypothetical protein